MFPKKSAKPTKKAFTNEQIRAKAYQIWEKNKEQSEEDNWNAAIKALGREKRFRVLISIWRWTGLGKKTGWDIFTGLSLPLIVFGGGILFNYLNGKQQQEVAEQKQKDELLKTYVNDMKGFLLDEKHSLNNNKSRSIAGTITLTTLAQLNSNQDEQRRKEGKYNQRKGLIMQFLFQSNLIKANPQLPLIAADFSFAYLESANLESADLQSADLQSANLQIADLRSANLQSAKLQSANLNFANLFGAKNLTNEQIKSACFWETAIYTESRYSISKSEYSKPEPKSESILGGLIVEDPKANQRKIDEIKQDKASDPPKPPDCSMWE